MKTQKLYTEKELVKKYADKHIFLSTYPHHHEYWNEKTHKYETVYEIRGTSKLVRENYQTVEEILANK